MRKSAAFLCTVVLALAFVGAGCPCIRAPINANESVRWWLFSHYGAEKICPEMLKRGVPLKVASLGATSVGRFFPTQCQTQISDADRSMAVYVAGSGYAFLPFARRVGFSAQARVEYRPDFRLESDAMYVWGRFTRMLEPPTLRILGVENPIVSLATQVPALGDVGTTLGQGIATSEISRGFTVVRSDDGDDFAIGILMPPDRPARPLKAGDDHKMLATDQLEIHASEREYIGPFEVSGNNQVLFVKLRAQGAPLNVVVVDRAVGDAWRQPYEAGQPLGPPPGPVIASGVVAPGESTQFFPLPPGLYYVVAENRAVSPVAPLGLPIPMPEASAQLTYAVEVGDRP